jgi:uncharacterized repeat protein (TIGR01451 family)
MAFATVRGAEPQSSTPPPPIRAAGRGASYLFLRDGRNLSSDYSGPAALTQALRNGQAQPLALASADFDEDGTPDLASGYANDDGTGILTVHRGSVDALWPYNRALRNGEPQAFLKDAHVFALPEAPDFLGAGDFDADGHWDLVAAHAGSKYLYYLRGNGHGGFAEAERIALPGTVTALTTGEINRADGLTDIAVGISAEGGPEVLIFESPAGALRGKPEVFAAPATVTALALMPLDDDGFNDLAVGAGNQLLAIHGRDRRLSYPKAVRDAAPAAQITSQTLPFEIRALTAGHFTTSTSSMLDLAVLGDDSRVHFLERPDADYQAARAELPASIAGRSGSPGPMRGGLKDARPLPPKPTVRDLALRDEVALPLEAGRAATLAVARTSISGADDAIVADAAGGQLHVISRNTSKARSMRLAASLGAAAGAPAAVLAMRLGPSALQGLVVMQAGRPEPAVMVQQVQNVFTVTNTQDPGAGQFNTQNLTVPGSLRWAISAATGAGGTSIVNFNIPVSDPNYNPNTGTFTIEPLPNTNCGGQVPCSGLPPLPPGCVLDGYTQPGGTLNGITQPAASPNTLANGDNAVLKITISGVLAGSGPDGIWLFNGSGTVRGLNIVGFNPAPNADGLTTTGGFGVNNDSGNNYVEGNFLGVDSTGTMAAPNYVGTGGFGGPNIVGGTTPQARNLLSGNTYSNFGSAVASTPQTQFVEGNYIGTDRTGTVGLSGSHAGLVEDGTGMTIGGTAAGAGNLISGNSTGVAFAYPAGNPFTPDNNLIQGNLIGTDPTGTVAVGNLFGMVVQSGQSNIIGGSAAGARNVVSGNYSNGIELNEAAEYTTVQGNYVGVDSSGGLPLGNGYSGIDHATTGNLANAYNTLIGGEAPQAGNVVSANSGYGMQFGGGAGPLAATVLGNFIGTDASGTHAMGNGLAGISIIQGASSIVIGGTDTPARNTIAYNNSAGVSIDPASMIQTGQAVGGSESVIGNAIFSNGAAGVAILSGTNNSVSQNSIYSNGGLGIDVDQPGTLVNNSCPPSTSGANHLQNAPALTAVPGGTALVSATATDPSGNTSEFSNCVTVSNSSNVLNIAGTLTSTANTAFTLEFFQNQACDGSGYGQGKTFLTRASVTTDASCHASFGQNPNIATADVGVSLGFNHNLYSAYVTPAQSFGYLATVTNSGPGGATGISLSDTLPSGVTLTSASSTQGTCNTSQNAVTCNLGALAAGATAQITMNVTITGVGTISDTASVSSTSTDSNSVNNSSTLALSSLYGYAVIDHFGPASAVTGSSGLPLTIYGFSFYAGTTAVTLNGGPLSYLGVTTANCGSALSPSPCQAINVTIPSSLMSAPGTLTIGVSNPAPGGNSGSPYTQPFTIYPNPGTVTQLLLSGIPNPATQSTNYNLTVTAADASGHAVPGYRGVVLLQDDYGDASFTPPSPYTFTSADNGTHTFGVTFSFAIQENLTVSDQGTPAISTVLPLTINPLLGAPAMLYAGGTPDSVPIGFPFPTPVSVAVGDATGNLLPGVTVTFQTVAAGNGASGTFSNGQSSIQVATDSTGYATAVVTANQTAGQFEVDANVGSLGSQWFLTSNANVPAHIAIVDGNPQSSPINTSFTGLLDVLVTDAQNNPVLEVPVTFSAPTSGPSVNLTSTVAGTSQFAEGFVQAGEARLDPIGVANGTPGNYQVTASVGALHVQFSFTNTPTQAAVEYLNAGGTPQTAVIHTQFAAKLFAVPHDANGNCLAQVPVTFAVPASGPSATLSTNSALSDALTCSAQVTATANGTAGAYNVTATAPGGITTTFALTNISGAATLLASSGTPQSAPIGTQFQTALQVTLLNASGNPVSGSTVNFSAPPTGASAMLSSSSVLTDFSGHATVFATANSMLGIYAVTATSGAQTATFSLTNVPPAAALSVALMHAGSFMQGQTGAAYTVTVGNLATAGPTSGAVTVAEILPPGLFLSSMAGSGWTCTVSSASCTRSDPLPAGANYAAIAVTVNVAADAPPSLTNQVTAQGGGSLLANASDTTAVIAVANPCDVNHDSVVNVVDAQVMVREGLGAVTAVHDLTGDGAVNVVDLQIVINAALNKGCSALI